LNGDDHVDKLEFAEYLGKRLKYRDSRVIVTDEFWNEVTEGRNDTLKKADFADIVVKLNEGKIFGRPWLVYPTQRTKYRSNFKATFTSPYENMHLSLIPVPNATLPYLQTDWQKWYNTIKDYNNTKGLSFKIPEDSEVSQT
jgi:hypothetical protein